MKKMMGEEKALVFFLTKSGFIPLDAKEGSRTYLGEPHKLEGIDRVKRPRVLSCRFLVKMTFMGVVTKPLPELGFDRRIFQKRILERKVWKKTSYNPHFQITPFLILS